MRLIIQKIIIFIIITTSSLSANSNFDDGLNFFQKKEFKKAKFKFEQDLIINPKNEKSYLYLSKIFNFQKKNELEEQNLMTVILLNPNNEEATYNLAKLKLENSDYKKSKKLNNRLLSFCKIYCKKSKKLKIEIENSLKK